MNASSIKANKTRLLLLAGALFAVTLCAAPASAGFAQDGTQLGSRLDQLENQVQTLSRAVYKGEKMPEPLGGAGDAPANSSAISGFEGRISDVEAQQRTITGQLEQMTHDIQQLKDRMEKMAADNELRFQQMDSKAGAAIPAASAAATGLPATPPAENTGAVSGTVGTLGVSDAANTLYESGFADIRDAKYDAAETKFKKFMATYPTHALAANAQYWLGETYYARSDYKQSAKIFAQNYQDYPQGAKASDSLLKLGLSLGKLGKKDDACLSFQQLKKQFPGQQSTVGRRADQEMKTAGCK